MSPSKKSLLVVFVAFLAVSALLWFYLAAIVTHYVNRKINRVGDYHGTIEKVSLDLWRGPIPSTD